jgi:hypothetical protein
LNEEPGSFSRKPLIIRADECNIGVAMDQRSIHSRVLWLFSYRKAMGKRRSGRTGHPLISLVNKQLYGCEYHHLRNVIRQNRRIQKILLKVDGEMRYENES